MNISPPLSFSYTSRLLGERAVAIAASISSRLILDGSGAEKAGVVPLGPAIMHSGMTSAQGADQTEVSSSLFSLIMMSLSCGLQITMSVKHSA